VIFVSSHTSKLSTILYFNIKSEKKTKVYGGFGFCLSDFSCFSRSFLLGKIYRIKNIPVDILSVFRVLFKRAVCLPKTYPARNLQTTAGRYCARSQKPNRAAA